ncbi:GAS2-like protein pickled eggs [Argiope bruennichi]|uniref:GAS2-like protein pickled eggs n=1 Tax=Argiope bruennichi TaxID=94029 RepID=UPI002494DF3B|nr:GAS2-like protein pickled eggs [Argiope bruennichi]
MAVFEDEDNGGRRPRPFRPFRSHEEYLYAMKEDLAEWLQNLYELSITADDFMDKLETGVVLCRHANRVITSAKRRGRTLGEECRAEVVYRPEVQPGTFHARDNVHNFIVFCRKGLRIKECLLFETDDLVMRKNEKNVVLCLLEVARRGTKFGMPAPLLVQMEREIDAEIAAHRDDSNEENRTPPSSLSLRGDSDEGHEADDDSESEPLATPRTPQAPQQQIVTNDLRSLHERVAELLNRCSCPAQFPMIRVGDGKYRIGETQLLIFVRILRNHVMVRVGGGWDTLEHYLDKHDPCRCKSGRRISVNRVSPSNSGTIQVHLNTHRPLSSGTPSSSRSSSVPTSPPSRRRSFDMSRFSSDDRNSSSRSSGDDWGPPNLRRGRGKSGRPSSADSSSEISEAELCRGGADFLRRQRRYSPRKVMKFGENNTCSEDAEDSSLEPQVPSTTVTPSPSPQRSRIPTSQSPSPQHRFRGGRLSASRSETSLFQQSPINRGGRTQMLPGNRRASQSGRQRSSSTNRTASNSPARTPEWHPKRRTLSLQSSPVKPVPPLLEEILNDSEVLDSDEKILERMEKLINEYRAREASPDSSLVDDCSAPIRPLSKTVRRNSLSKIPILNWQMKQ